MTHNDKFLPRGRRQHDPLPGGIDEPAASLETLRAEIAERRRAEEQVRMLKDQLADAILARKRAEDALHVQEEHLGTLISAVHGFPYHAGIAEGKPVSVQYGPGCLAVTGYEPEAFIRNPALELLMIAREDRHPVSRAVQSILSGARTAAVEYRIRCRDGTLRWVHNTINARHDAAGNLTGYDGFITDITDRKRLERQLHHAQQREMAALLATSVMHDFNNILTAMLGHASLLEIDMPHEDPLYQHVRYIVQLTERASLLTRKILSYSGKQDLSPQIIDLRAIVQDLQPLIQPLLGANVRLTLRLTAGALPVEADQLQLEQMLMNLAVNARDAMPAGGNLTISTGSVTSLPGQNDRTASGPSASYAHIKVSDTGEGISQDSLRRIYESFFTTKSTGKGTGLGLSIVRDIVERYRGLITCTSSPGRGTVFDLYLPLAAREEGSGEAPIGIDLLEGSEAILIAEDDPVVRHIAVQTMKKLGYSVIEAVDGDDARRKFALEGADVRCLVIDIFMAGSVGASVYQDISREKPGIPVLFISGYTTEELRQRGISLEGHLLLMKPFSPHALVSRVRRLIGETGDRRPDP